VAAATGGVWKTTDGGVTLQQAWPDDASQSMGAVAVGPDGAIWAGTGELNPGGGSITFGGTGGYRSDDGARTWKSKGLQESGTTGRIVVHPTDPRIVYVAAGGSLFNPGGERGIYRSTNGGASWELVLAAQTPFTGGADLAIDPRNPSRLYAAMWDHRREPDVRTYGGVGSGVFRTEDGGDTWQRLDNVLTKTPGDASGLVSDASLGRIGVAVAPDDPDRVYVITTATSGRDKGFYVSDDGGDSFTTATLPGSQGGFGWWFGRIWVDPANRDHLFVAGVRLREFNSAGERWGDSSGVHADQHALQWDPSVPERVYLGNDGGLYRSDANGANMKWTKAAYEPYTPSPVATTRSIATGARSRPSPSPRRRPRRFTSAPTPGGCGRRKTSARPGTSSPTLVCPSDGSRGWRSIRPTRTWRMRRSRASAAERWPRTCSERATAAAHGKTSAAACRTPR